jgi:3-oxoacyl-[acyl-carrier-protein] synthase-3
MNMTAIANEKIEAALERSPLGYKFSQTQNPVTRHLAVELALVWQDFMARLDKVPIVAKIEGGTVTVEDYKRLLVNIRQQVIEGGRWIARTASSMTARYLPIRSALIGHAAAEHKDFQMIEANHRALGGSDAEMHAQPKNIGSEAFSAFMFHQASQPDPIDLFGAMFIIEGLGTVKAGRWANLLKQHLGLEDAQVSFLAYHGVNDDSHYDKLRMILSLPLIDQPTAERIVRTAKVVARLYALQLEELDNV